MRLVEGVIEGIEIGPRVALCGVRGNGSGAILSDPAIENEVPRVQVREHVSNSPVVVGDAELFLLRSVGPSQNLRKALIGTRGELAGPRRRHDAMLRGDASRGAS